MVNDGNKTMISFGENLDKTETGFKFKFKNRPLVLIQNSIKQFGVGDFKFEIDYLTGKTNYQEIKNIFQSIHDEDWFMEQVEAKKS